MTSRRSIHRSFVSFSFAIAGACCPLAIFAQAQSAPAEILAKPAALAQSATNRSLDLIFVDPDFKPKGLASGTDVDSDYVSWGVPGISALVQQRAPMVLAANQLSGQVKLLPSGEASEAAKSVNPASPTVLLQLASITKRQPRLFMTVGHVVFDAAYFAGSSSGSPEWSAKLGSSSLGAHPALGILKTNRVDAQWVDEILVLALDQLAKKGLIQLPSGKAVLPGI